MIFFFAFCSTFCGGSPDDTEKFLLHNLQNACSLSIVLGSNHAASAAHSGLNLQRNLFFFDGVPTGRDTFPSLSFDAVLE